MMFSTRLLSLSAILLAAAVTPAQIDTFGGDGERKSSSRYFYDRGAKALVGGLDLQYGAPAWKDDYNKIVESDKDANMRLGSGGWACLDTSLPITLGGVAIPAGQWYLGLSHKGGSFRLMVMDAAELRTKKIPAWVTPTLTAKILAPLEHAKTEASAAALTIRLVPDAAVKSKLSFRLNWGKHQLTAPIVVDLDSEKEGAGKPPAGKGR